MVMNCIRKQFNLFVSLLAFLFNTPFIGALGSRNVLSALVIGITCYWWYNNNNNNNNNSFIIGNSLGCTINIEHGIPPKFYIPETWFVSGTWAYP